VATSTCRRSSWQCSALSLPRCCKSSRHDRRFESRRRQQPRFPRATKRHLLRGIPTSQSIHILLRKQAQEGHVVERSLVIRSRARSRRSCPHVCAPAHAHVTALQQVRTLTQRFSGACYLRSWTRCRRSDRAPPLTGSHQPFSTSSYLTLTTEHLSMLRLTRFACV
jgi:hypothetical protein